MVNLAQLLELERAGRLYHSEFHYTGKRECTRVVGPRGGAKETITRVQVSGNLQTWKRDTARYRLPVKHGLRESASIEPYNQDCWHLASECPLATI